MEKLLLHWWLKSLSLKKRNKKFIEEWNDHQWRITKINSNCKLKKKGYIIFDKVSIFTWEEGIK